MKFIRKVKQFFTLSDRILTIECNMQTLIIRVTQLTEVFDRLLFIESEMSEIQIKINQLFDVKVKEFEKKVQEMTFAYTKNIDDVKTDYLKRYLEVRLNCMQTEISSLPSKISELQSEIVGLELKLEHKED